MCVISDKRPQWYPKSGPGGQPQPYAEVGHRSSGRMGQRHSGSDPRNREREGGQEKWHRGRDRLKETDNVHVCANTVYVYQLVRESVYVYMNYRTCAYTTDNLLDKSVYKIVCVMEIIFHIIMLTIIVRVSCYSITCMACLCIASPIPNTQPYTYCNHC